MKGILFSQYDESKYHVVFVTAGVTFQKLYRIIL